MANADAGDAAEERLGSVVSILASDAPVRVHRTGGPEELDGLLASLPDGAVPVAFGGDGTIGSLVQALVSRGAGDRPVGLVPGGTGNDLARGVGVPLAAGEAARLLLAARPQPMAAISVGGRFGVNALHLGIGAAASRRSAAWKPRLGRLAYPAGALVTGVTGRGWPLHVTVPGEGETWRGPALMAALLVGRTIGGGTELVPAAGSPAGHGRLLVSGDVTPLRRVGFARSLLADDPWRRGTVLERRVDRVVVSSDRSFPVNLDGEDLGDHRSLELAVIPDAWTLLAAPSRS